TPMDVDTSINRTNWTGEELVEFLYASVKGDITEFKELTDMFINGIDSTKDKIIKNKPEIDDVLTHQIDALIDTLYFVYGSFSILGVDPEPFFDIVHKANMSKLFPDGKPRFRESDGKIIKPDTFIAPEPLLKEELERQKELPKHKPDVPF